MSIQKKILLFSSLTALTLAGTALAAPVRGKIDVELRAVEIQDTPNHLRVRNGFIPTAEPQVDLQRVLRVAILREGADASSNGAAGCGAELRGGALFPATLIASPGASLSVQNRDGTSYHLSAETIDGLSAEPLAAGHVLEFSAPEEPGDHLIRDAYYTHLSGQLVVIEDLVDCAEVDADGSFRFESIDPGEYTVRVFLHGEAVHDTSLIVPPYGSQTITLPPLAL